MTMIPAPMVYQNLVTLDIDAGQHTLISLKPAEVSLSLTDFTAWNGVGEALTNDKKSFAAVLILTELMVAVLNLLLKIKLSTMYLNRVGRLTFQVKIDTRVEGYRTSSFSIGMRGARDARDKPTAPIIQCPVGNPHTLQGHSPSARLGWSLGLVGLRLATW